ncbi:MAG: heat-shock protein [Cyclobacteriaceae bacterium]|nr:MAG: heat-shock protein [Cyclobacteriaceae bacterium]
MTLMRRTNTWPNLNTFFDDFLTGDFFDNKWSNFSATGTTVPAVNIVETKDDFQVEMAAPGMGKGDFNIELDNDMLTISSDKQDSKEEQESSYSRREFSYLSFKRSFHLPNTVEAEKIKAKYQDGVLRLVIPKKEEAKTKPVRQISIS